MTCSEKEKGCKVLPPDLEGQTNSSLLYLEHQKEGGKKEHEFGLESASDRRGTQSKIVTDGQRCSSEVEETSKKFSKTALHEK